MRKKLEKKKLEKELDEWENYEPVNGMGKWARQVRISSIVDKLKKLTPKRKKKAPKPDNPTGWDDNTTHTEGSF